VKILVTGAAGLVGRHLARTLARDHDLLALKRSDLDISDRDAVDRYVSAEKPSLIVNCAVIQVDESEQNPPKAQAVNVEGPRLLAAAASNLDAEIIHFSTQYAFDGEPVGRPPYTIEDEPRPVNVYGKTKVASEEAVRAACARSYIIRTSWVYGSGKNSFLCTVHNDLRAGKGVGPSSISGPARRTWKILSSRRCEFLARVATAHTISSTRVFAPTMNSPWRQAVSPV